MKNNFSLCQRAHNIPSRVDAKDIPMLLLCGFLVLLLTGCGGGGGGAQSTAFQLRQQQQQRYVPPPLTVTETAPAKAQRDANNDFKASAQSPRKTYVADTQALRIGSLENDDTTVVFTSQAEGLSMLFELYNADGEKFAKPIGHNIVCDPCPSPEMQTRISDRFQAALSEAELVEPVTITKYKELYTAAAVAEGFEGVFTHSKVGFEHYELDSGEGSESINIAALSRVIPVITGAGTRSRQSTFDVALFGRRLPMEEDRLDYMSFGVWAYNEDATNEDAIKLVGGFAFGVETPAELIPATGEATYTGSASGLVGPREGDATANLRGVDGDVEITANFETNAVIAKFTDMKSSDASDNDWHDFTFTGTLDAGSRNQYSATTIEVTNKPAAIASGVDLLDAIESGSEPTGSLGGRFYGPIDGGETGGRWGLGDMNTVAVGSFGAKREREPEPEQQ